MYQKENRRIEKETKKHEWAKKGGHIAPIFVPSTPDSELLKAMRQIAKEEGKQGVRFNIIETGGITMKRSLQRSNPTATPGCQKEDCMCCAEGRGKGGQCHRTNVNYQIECKLCPEDKKFIYIGETSRNLYTRMGEHSKDRERNEEGSFMTKHLEQYHNGEGDGKDFSARVTHVNRDCLTRQIREGVLIKNRKINIMNTKSEWHQPALFEVQSEIVRI